MFIPAIDPELDTEYEVIWAQVQLPGLKYHNVGAFHGPDHTDDSYLENLNTFLERISKNTPHIWLRGDFNLPNVEQNHSFRQFFLNIDL